ncbi:HAMP domain-containing protein [Pusillimonas sp. DMV24BSW_D]|uniref:methyl-accepting chemotaxis protein n=1 Tax=Neopusillimonas aestuarii TaxID=2716226 RepID=UPI00140752B0|nr:methyl-accepting chemotaxis protein [Pusillimonas sp. DMV24BSW_D]QIM49848.1 HAMP domain-containing protein [Pusillimonas sp. DMV24BSW_D]
MNRFKIGTRLTLGFGLMLVFMAILMAVSLMRMNAGAQATGEITERGVAKERLVSRWLSVMNENSIQMQILGLLYDPGLRKEFETAIEKGSAESTKIQKELQLMLSDPEALALFQDTQRKRAAFGKANDEALQAQRDGDFVRADNMLQKTVPGLRAEYEKSVRALLEFQQKHMNDAAAQLDADNQLAIKIVFGVGVVALILGVLFAFGITRSIVRPLQTAVGYAKAISNRDLTRQVEVRGKDETAELLQALRMMNQNLVGVISKVQSGSESIATASGEIASGNTDLSSRTEEQASSLAETAATMEQLTTTVQLNTDNARKANQLAGSASKVAVESGDVVGQVVETMSSIDQRAKQVADIITVIDGIAFQTNILALNAAVEAARAGEQGKGFAVVASEVRSLAQRSAQAAKEIKELIEMSVAATNQGNLLVGKAGQSMKDTVDSIKQVVDIMEEIAAASEEQSTGIEQVNQAVMQMDQVTQQNAALVEEASVASQNMQAQAADLSRLVSTFKVNLIEDLSWKKTDTSASSGSDDASPGSSSKDGHTSSRGAKKASSRKGEDAELSEDDWVDDADSPEGSDDRGSGPRLALGY